MWDGTEVFLLVAATQLALLAGILLREHRDDPSARASVFFIGTIVAHLALPILVGHGAPPVLLHVSAPVSCCVPFAFWLLAKVHFDDDFRFSPRHGAGLAGFMALHYGAWLAGSGGIVPGPPLDRVPSSSWMMAAAAVSVALMVHALVHVFMGARSDLV